MRLGRLLLRIVGWLLTPFVAWAASFLGATLGALGARALAPKAGLLLTVAMGAIAGFATLWIVIHFLRTTPELRHALRVTKEGMPIADLDEFLEDSPETPPPAEENRS